MSGAGLVPLTCPKCGASLPARDSDLVRNAIVCAYCETSFEPPRAAAPFAGLQRGVVYPLGTYVPPAKKKELTAAKLLLWIVLAMALVVALLIVIIQQTK